MTDKEKDVTEIENVQLENATLEAGPGKLDIEVLTKKVETLNDQLLRTLAENQNLRRRAQKDLEDAHNYAISKFVKDLLVVADNFERALELVAEGVEDENKLTPFIKGIELTHKELQRVLESHNVEKHVPINEPFDHNFHQALFEIPTSDKTAGTVVQVVQPGYSLNNRLLRPAMVGVAKSDK